MWKVYPMKKATPKTKASRYANQRMHYDEDTIFNILDEALLCTVSYSLENQPFAIPTAFVRIGNKLYIHGSVGSHFLMELKKGIPVCISVFLADEIVIAKSAFHHSFNYRSVVIFSQARCIDDIEEKSTVFKLFTEKMVPGSWDYLRPMQIREVNKTMLLEFEISEASAKMRKGMPIDDQLDEDLPIWSGIIPLNREKGTPVPDEKSLNIPLPKHLQRKQHT